MRIEPPVPERTALFPSLQWKISSTPCRFPESQLINDLSYGYNRAQLSWYNIDPIFQSVNPLLPPHISPTAMADDYVRTVFETEVYPDRDIPSGVPTPLTILNLTYHPTTIGPYNYELHPTEYSAGINESGKLIDPASRWAGISRVLEYIDHDINFIEFWLMDPFIHNENISGNVYIELGDFSEEVLYDNIHQNEATISNDTANNHYNCWGLSGTSNTWAYEFANIEYQDFGFDGLNNVQEQKYFEEYLAQLSQICSPEAYSIIYSDPSKDDYHYYRGTDYDNAGKSIIERYESFNGLEGNSTPNFPYEESYPTRITQLPDREDISKDEFLNTQNDYFEYEINIRKSDFFKGTNYIDSVRLAWVNTVDMMTHKVYWYRFRIPIQEYTSTVGTPILNSDLRMIRFYYTGFNDPVTLRLAGFYLSE